MNSEKEKKAIERLRAFAPDDGYYLCYSGGKDSDVIRILAKLADVKHECWHNLTTVDAPETVKYVKSVPEVKISYPDTTMWKLIEKKLYPPTRISRYCCEQLKERGGKGKVKITGVRWAESPKRKESADVVRIIPRHGKAKISEPTNSELHVSKQGGILLSGDNDKSRRMVEMCYRTRETTVNPIVDWGDRDVWDFLHHYGCESNPLYQCGFHRIGCIGCPIAGGRMQRFEFNLYPKYYKNYILAFERMVTARKKKGLPTEWNDGEDVMLWWLNEPGKDQQRLPGF